MSRTIMRVSVLTSCVLGLAALAAYSIQPTGSQPSFVFQLKGTAIGELRDIDTDGDGVPETNANCFDIGLYDPFTGMQIGTASDCLSDVNILSTEPGGPNIALTGTTFFNLSQGTLVTQGLTSVRPVVQPTTRDGIVYTHMTGANGDGGVMYGSQRFKKMSGKVRLSGLVDLANLVADNEITFDCLFVVSP